MKALLLNNRVADVQVAEFEVHESMTWMDCSDDCAIGWSLVDGALTAPVVESINPALLEIQRLESSVTPRRIREMTTVSGKQWVNNVEELIAIERGKL